jgi:chromosome segregation ATPase
MAQPLDKMSVFNTGPSQNTLAIDGLQQAMRALHRTVDMMAQELSNAKRETLEVRAQLEKYETRQDVQATVHGLDKRIKGLENEQYIAERSFNFLWPENKFGEREHHESVAYKLRDMNSHIATLTRQGSDLQYRINYTKGDVIMLRKDVEEQLGQHNAVIETVPALEQRLAKLEQAVHKFEPNTSAKPLYSGPHDDEYEALKRSLEKVQEAYGGPV